MKFDLLQELDRHSFLDAQELAESLDVSYEAASMALLRLVRQNLARRYADSDSRLYVYQLTPKGELRLDHFLEDGFDD